ncbi:MAG: hypothetical protein KDC25_11875, partial [Saprospiraceae bacterium]|nr:hypothetical protein [Saprospiraceae bacterium]
GTIVQHETCEIPKNFFGYAESFLELRKSPLHYLGLKRKGSHWNYGITCHNSKLLTQIKLSGMLSAMFN